MLFFIDNHSHFILSLSTDRGCNVPALRASQHNIYELRQPRVSQDYGEPVLAGAEWLRTWQQIIPQHCGRRGESSNGYGVHAKHTKQS